MKKLTILKKIKKVNKKIKNPFLKISFLYLNPRKKKNKNQIKMTIK